MCNKVGGTQFNPLEYAFSNTIENINLENCIYATINSEI